MLCKCHWIVLYTVHFTAFCLGSRFFPGHGVDEVIVWRIYSVVESIYTLFAFNSVRNCPRGQFLKD